MSNVTSFSVKEASAPSIDSLEVRCQSLERRLNEGYSRIEAALEGGQDVSSWEHFWIDLLHEYEMVCNQLQEAA